MASVDYYVSGRLKRLQTLPQIMEREVKSGLRRGLTRLRSAVGDEFRSRGVGRSIFAVGYRKGALKTILARERVKKSGDGYEVGLRVKGVAAIVARGGRTRAHPIGAAGQVLANPKTGFFVRGRVNHPGSQMQRDDFPGRALAKVGGAFRVEVDKGMARVAEVVGRG